MTNVEFGMMLFAMFTFQVGIAGAIKTSRRGNDYGVRFRVLLQLALYVLFISIGWLFTKDDTNHIRELVQVIMATSVAFVIAMLIMRARADAKLRSRIGGITQPRAKRRNPSGGLLRRPSELTPSVVKRPEHLFDFRV